MGFSRYAPILQSRLVEFYWIRKLASIAMCTYIKTERAENLFFVIEQSNKKFKSNHWVRGIKRLGTTDVE